MDTGTEIREAVRIIIERYRNHPEEFVDEYNSKFGWVFSAAIKLKSENFIDVLNEAEKAAIDEIYKDYKYRHFHDRVMKALLEDTQYEARVEAQGKLHPVQGGWVNPQAIYGTTISNGGIGQQYQLMEQQGSSLKPPSSFLTSGQLDTLKRLFGVKAK